MRTKSLGEDLSYPITYSATWPKTMDPHNRWLITRAGKLFFQTVLFPILYVKWVVKDLTLRFLVQGYPPNVPLNFSTLYRFIFFPEEFRVDLREKGQRILDHFKGQRTLITTPDGADLDCAFFPGKNRSRAILLIPGTLAQWELYYNRIRVLKPLNVSILIGNVRGVGKSSGGWRDEERYELDVASMYQLLMKREHLKTDQIAVVGFSMGGALGAKAAARMKKEFPKGKVNMINLCSFSTLTKEIDALLAKRGRFLMLIPRLCARLLNLNLNAKKAWDTLDDKTLFFNPVDNLVLEDASLYRAVKENPQGTTRAIVMEKHGHGDPHNRYFNPEEKKLYQLELARMLNIDLSTTELNPHIPTHPAIEVIKA